MAPTPETTRFASAPNFDTAHLVGSSRGVCDGAAREASLRPITTPPAVAGPATASAAMTNATVRQRRDRCVCRATGGRAGPCAADWRRGQWKQISFVSAVAPVRAGSVLRAPLGALRRTRTPSRIADRAVRPAPGRRPFRSAPPMRASGRAQPAREELVGDHSEREPVARRGCALAGDLLGRQVPAVPTTSPCAVSVVSPSRGEIPEVGDVDVLVGVEEEILRLDVPVDDSRGMGVVERLGRLLEPAQDLRARGWAALPDARPGCRSACARTRRTGGAPTRPPRKP